MENENIPNPQKKESFWKELLKFAIIAIVIIVPFRMYIAQPFIVSGASMDITFKDGDYLIVDQLTYDFKDPERGSVIIFKYPKDPKRYYIKRIIGLPGETIKIENQEVTIINKENPNGLKLTEPYIKFPSINQKEITLNDDQFFVMGDNRAQSSDSREWGPVARKFLIGRPILRLFPLTKLGFMPGDYENYLGQK